MDKNYASLIAGQLNLQPWQVENTLALFAQKATIPFISRYRKEMTGSLDEVQIQEIKERHARFVELDTRREAVIKSVDEQGFLTPDLRAKFEAATTLTELEDLYLPYRPKKKTRASMAREKGLEPLAQQVFRQMLSDPSIVAAQFLNDKVATVEDALQGARDIIAEWVSEDVRARNGIRRLFTREAVITSHVVKTKEAEGVKFSDYYEFSEPLSKCPPIGYLPCLGGKRKASFAFLSNRLRKMHRKFLRNSSL
jgi:uncharacterized protein